MNAPKLLYITSDGHSGSSLLDVVLGAQPGVSATGEVHRLSITPETRECSCGAYVSSCSYWNMVRVSLAAQYSIEVKTWEDFPVTAAFQLRNSSWNARILSQASLIIGSTRLMSGLSHINKTMEAQIRAAENSWRLFGAISESTKNGVVVDSTKTPGRLKALYLAQPRQTYVIHLVRDGRAVAWSDIRRTGRSVRDAAQCWRRENLKVLAMLKSIPRSKVHFVRYEDFCRSPDDVVASIMEFVGCEITGSISIPPKRQIHSIPGNPALLSGLRPIRLDDSWRYRLTPSDLDSFDSVAGALNGHFGYERTGS